MKAHFVRTSLVKVLLGLTFLVFLLHIVLVFLDIKITSDKARRVLIEHIEVLMQRETVIDDKVEITVSLLPEIVVKGIHIKNIEGYGDTNFITVNEARVSVELWPLLTGNILLDEIKAKQAHISLIRDKDGSNNWSFDYLKKEKVTNKKSRVKTQGNGHEQKRVLINEISLEDINLTYEDKMTNDFMETKVSKLYLDLDDITHPAATITGSIKGYPYELGFISDSINDLTSGQPWVLQGAGTIAGSATEIDATIQFHQHLIQCDIDSTVKDINVGLLLEEFGIIAAPAAASSELVIQINTEGQDITDVFKQANIELELRQGYWRWQAVLQDEVRELLFNKARLNTSWYKPVVLHVDGTLFENAIKLDLTTNQLNEFFEEANKLDIDLTAQVVDSKVNLKGMVDLPVDKQQFQLDVSFMGKNLEKLNRILNSELPPFNNYSLSGNIISNKSGYILRADDATIGNTHFNGVIVIDESSFKPFWKINLISRQLQIRDFEFIEFDDDDSGIATLKDSLQRNTSDQVKPPGWRLKKIVDNPRMHFDLSFEAEEVMAGESALGGSRIKLKLRDDTLILEQAELNIPGGHIKSSASFTVNENNVTGNLKLDIDKFEYGAVARYFVPGSPEGGVISARIDLQLDGPDFTRLFDQANGKLDIALWPRNTKSKMFDLWATNLFLIILPEIRKKESKMNCMVALMDIDDGIMKEDFFGIDTTSVWMTGNINVDFKQEYVKLSLFPRSKTARLFAVQAPIRAEGGFDDIHLVTNPVDITAAYVSFITSPLHVPARRIFDRKVPADASEACERFFDRDYVKAVKDKIEAEEQKDIEEWLESN